MKTWKYSSRQVKENFLNAFAFTNREVDKIFVKIIQIANNLYAKLYRLQNIEFFYLLIEIICERIFFQHIEKLLTFHLHLATKCTPIFPSINVSDFGESAPLELHKEFIIHFKLRGICGQSYEGVIRHLRYILGFCNPGYPSKDIIFVVLV